MELVSLDRTHPIYLAVAIFFALLLQIVIMWKLRRSLPEHVTIEHRDDEPKDPKGAL